MAFSMFWPHCNFTNIFYLKRRKGMVKRRARTNDGNEKNGEHCKDEIITKKIYFLVLASAGAAVSSIANGIR